MKEINERYHRLSIRYSQVEITLVITDRRLCKTRSVRESIFQKDDRLSQVVIKQHLGETTNTTWTSSDIDLRSRKNHNIARKINSLDVDILEVSEPR